MHETTRKYAENVVRRYIWNPADVEDVTQEVLLKAFSRRELKTSDCLETTWIFKIAKHTALDFLRKKARQSRDLTHAVHHFEPHPGGQLNARHDLAVATSAVKAMGPKCAEVFHLRYLQENTEGEVAKALGISLAAVKARANRSRQVALQAVSG